MENNKVQKILHLRSTALNEDNSPKLPEVNDIHYGEIAVNYHKGVETIAIKNNEDEITTFKSDKYYEEKYASKEYVQQSFFVGTPEEYNVAFANGQIAVGALVILLDDEIKDDTEGNLQIGTSAQKVQEIYPELTSRDADSGKLALDYAKLSIIALKAIDTLHEENKLLRKELEELKEKVNTKRTRKKKTE